MVIPLIVAGSVGLAGAAYGIVKNVQDTRQKKEDTRQEEERTRQSEIESQKSLAYLESPVENVIAATESKTDDFLFYTSKYLPYALISIGVALLMKYVIKK